MNQQRICSALIFLCGIISLIKGQGQQQFPNFGQPTFQGQANPALFQQFLQTQQATRASGFGGPATAPNGFGGAATATNGFGGVPASPNGFGTQGAIRTVTVPVLPAPGNGFTQGGATTRFGQTSIQRAATGQTDGPIPRFGTGTGIGRPFTQFGLSPATPQRTTGLGNGAMRAARQRQLAMMRRNAQARTMQQTSTTAANPGMGPFTGLGLGGAAQIQNQQALARMRAAGGMPPFGMMPGRPPMFPGGFGRPAMQANATLAGQAGNLWRPNVNMPGMVRPPGTGVPPPGFPGMFPPGFVPGAGANRIMGRQNGAVTGFTGSSNQLVQNVPSPILNPRDPRIGLMPALGAASARAAANQLNTPRGATADVRAANQIRPALGAQPNVADFPGAIPQNVAESSNTITTATETKTLTNNLPEVAAFPGAVESESTSAVDIAGFPGMESGGVATGNDPVAAVFPEAEKPFGPGEFPPPPPVFPAGDINNIPVSADASLFGTVEFPSGLPDPVGSFGDTASKSSSSSTKTNVDQGTGSSTVEVTQFESTNTLTSNANSDVSAFPGSGVTDPPIGDMAAPVATAPPGTNDMTFGSPTGMEASSFPGMNGPTDAGGVPIQPLNP